MLSNVLKVSFIFLVVWLFGGCCSGGYCTVSGVIDANGHKTLFTGFGEDPNNPIVYEDGKEVKDSDRKYEIIDYIFINQMKKIEEELEK